MYVNFLAATMSLSALVDASKTSLLLSLGSITFNPTVWNIVARNEYRNKTITHIFGGNPHLGCYFLAACIFSAGILRDHLTAAGAHPPRPLDMLVPVALFAAGQTFVVTSTWTLGSRARLPVNVLRDPMYVGSTMCFAATALWYERPIGLLITFYVYVVYTIALKFEGPFTDMIYSKRSTSTSSKKLFDKEL
ncbi:hypothetical protein BJV77DRAFT_1020509 [Russula vinacea]|nr:hypothetical protein BJV77DRAFT_1020509 [Russula vinacea]